MTIRRTLLLAFLAVGLLPALAVTLLAFTRSQQALRAEIGHALAAQARITAADLDQLLFERLQNAVTWAQLEVLQDLQIGDVDKRLSSFLATMKLRYGDAYLDLHAIDPASRVVASSSVAAIGTTWPPLVAWRSAELAGGTVQVAAPRREAAGRQVLELRVAVPSEFASGELGALVLRVNWQAVQTLLDAGARQQRLQLVIDEEGQLIAHSVGMAPPAATRLDASWQLPANADAVQRDGAPLLGAEVIATRALAPGRGEFRGFGWSTLVLQPVATALAPVRAMAWSFAGILLLTLAVTALLASGTAARIARPITALTQFVRGFRQQQPQAVPPPPRGREVAELSTAFLQLIDDLEGSRQALVRAAQLAAIGEFAAVMAHEIRTPLGILRTSAQMLASERQLSPEGRELLGFVDSETNRLNALVATMLDRSRARPPQRTAVDLEALIGRALAMLAPQARRRQVQLQQQQSGMHPLLELDPEQWLQVLFNLVQNALHLVPEGGTIRVTTLVEAGPPETLWLEVADNGPGIPEAERARIFEPFVHRREGGLGLGLAVVKQIASAHGAEISVGRSPDLGGALFRLRLPMHPAPP